MPIEPASKVSYNWAKEMINSFKNIKEQAGPGVKFTHTAKCPGIALIARQGWVQKTYQDIFIKTDRSGNIEWRTPLDQSKLMVHDFSYPYVNLHSRQDLEPYGLIKPDTFPIVIKIQSPWTVKVPAGYFLLCSPIPYNDDSRFTATMGLIDGDAGINFLNAQLFWHVQEGQEVIPAGTPIAQYFLIKKEKIDVEIRGYTDEDLNDLRLRQVVVESSFLQSYSKLKFL